MGNQTSKQKSDHESDSVLSKPMPNTRIKQNTEQEASQLHDPILPRCISIIIDLLRKIIKKRQEERQEPKTPPAMGNQTTKQKSDHESDSVPSKPMPNTLIKQNTEQEASQFDAPIVPRDIIFAMGNQTSKQKSDHESDSVLSKPMPNTRIKRNTEQEASQFDAPRVPRDEAIYPVNGPGYMLLINYAKERQGSDVDKHSLKEFFGQTLGFFIHEADEDMSKTELLECLKSQSTQMDRKYYCFVCIIMAHGTEIGIHTGDGVISMKTIMSEFDNCTMTQFAGKPKVFIINACRGSNEKLGAVYYKCDQTQFDGLPEASKRRALQHSDIAECYSTVPEYVSRRRASYGSVFIQKCLQVFKKDYKTSDILELMTTVNREVQKDEIQVPQVASTLTRKLYLVKYPRN